MVTSSPNDSATGPCRRPRQRSSAPMARTTGGRAVARARSTVSSSSRASDDPEQEGHDAGRDRTRPVISTPARSSPVTMARGRSSGPGARLTPWTPPGSSWRVERGGLSDDAQPSEQLPLLVLEQGVDLGNVLVGDALVGAARPGAAVLEDVAVALETHSSSPFSCRGRCGCWSAPPRPGAWPASRTPCAVLGELGEGQVDDLPSLDGSMPQVGVADRLSIEAAALRSYGKTTSSRAPGAANAGGSCWSGVGVP